MKKIFLLFLVMPIFLFAENYEFVVESPMMVEVYWLIFNALASIFNSQTYIDLLKLVFLFGGFIMLTKGVLATYEGSASAKMISDYGKYLIIVTGLLTILNVGDETDDKLVITTNQVSTYCTSSNEIHGQVVDNVPSVLAYFFQVLNMSGKELTNLAEIAFSDPASGKNPMSISETNGYLGNLKETIRILSIDPTKTSNGQTFDFTNAWGTFFAQCVYLSLNNKGVEGSLLLKQAYHSDNLLKFSEELMTKNIDNSNLGAVTLDWMGSQYECGAFLAYLKTETDLYVNSLNSTGCVLPYANAGVLELLTGNVGQNSAGAAEMAGIARQAGLINSFKASKAINNAGIQGAESFTGGTAKATFNMNNISSGSYMAEMIPYLQAAIRAIVYAFFPFVFVMMILPGGLKILGQYIKTLLWVELWTPTAAIIHMLMSFYTKNKLTEVSAQSNLTETGISLMNSVDMLSETATIAGVGGYLYLSIPPLTWMILTGSGQMLGNLVSGVSSSFSNQLANDQSGKGLDSDLKRQQANNENLKSGKSQAMSYGEMMFYDNLNKSAKDAGDFVSGNQLGANNLLEKQKNDTINSFIDTKKKTEENKALGLLNDKGDLDLNKVNDYSKLSGQTSGIKTLADLKKYDSDNSNSLSKEEIQSALALESNVSRQNFLKEAYKAQTIKENNNNSNNQGGINTGIGDGKQVTATTKATLKTEQEDLNKNAQQEQLNKTANRQEMVEMFGSQEKAAEVAAAVAANKTDIDHQTQEKLEKSFGPNWKKVVTDIANFDYKQKNENIDALKKNFGDEDNAIAASASNLANQTLFTNVQQKATKDKIKDIGNQISKSKDPQLQALNKQAEEKGYKSDLEKGLYVNQLLKESQGATAGMKHAEIMNKLNVKEDELANITSLQEQGEHYAVQKMADAMGEDNLMSVYAANKAMATVRPGFDAFKATAQFAEKMKTLRRQKQDALDDLNKTKTDKATTNKNISDGEAALSKDKSDLSNMESKREKMKEYESEMEEKIKKFNKDPLANRNMSDEIERYNKNKPKLEKEKKDLDRDISEKSKDVKNKESSLRTERDKFDKLDKEEKNYERRERDLDAKIKNGKAVTGLITATVGAIAIGATNGKLSEQTSLALQTVADMSNAVETVTIGTALTAVTALSESLNGQKGWEQTQKSLNKQIEEFKSSSESIGKNVSKFKEDMDEQYIKNKQEGKITVPTNLP